MATLLSFISLLLSFLSVFFALSLLVLFVRKSLSRLANKYEARKEYIRRPKEFENLVKKNRK
ncbi:hypothetical protein F0310_05035 (plasmid) [Borrelia sp. A-FGy1]|uniref:hypothetical protein n=1 Tax=Borrelia sp. A-FGy1 TaxID=2608247 RepID=UPI0015F4AD5F|nr:hypothetical protein [Borrelia sp. A-FGy1]QMU99782.1 hypothetical protein F0310_05035 [Borrelia sp. A-FGy1]